MWLLWFSASPSTTSMWASFRPFTDTRYDVASVTCNGAEGPCWLNSALQHANMWSLKFYLISREFDSTVNHIYWCRYQHQKPIRQIVSTSLLWCIYVLFVWDVYEGSVFTYLTFKSVSGPRYQTHSINPTQSLRTQTEQKTCWHADFGERPVKGGRNCIQDLRPASICCVPAAQPCPAPAKVIPSVKAVYTK